MENGTTFPTIATFQQSESFEKALIAGARSVERRGDVLWVLRGGAALASRAPKGAQVWRPGVAVHLLSPDVAEPRALWREGFFQVMTAATVAEWDIRPEVSVLRAGLHQKWRNALRRGEAARLRVFATQLPPDPTHWLLRAEAAQRRARGYRALPTWLAAAWAQVAPRDTLLLQAGPAHAPVAAMLFLIHGRGATYHIGWTAREGAEAHRVLLWQGMLRLRDRGVERIDLGTLDTVNAPGLARFKLDTGATARALGGTWARTPLTALPARLLAQFSIQSPSGQKA